MSSHEWETMNDKDFETILESSFSEPLSDDIVTDVTPWKKAMSRVLVGLALNAVTLNFGWLNYILPAIGTILLMLGFRALRHENKWFRSCFILSIIHAAYFFSSMILNTTIIQSAVYASQITQVLTIANLALLLIEFVCLWRGFISVQQKVNLPPHARGAAALIVWYALMCVLGLIRYSGLIIAGAMLVGYVFIIRSLYKLSQELDEAGYAIHPASLKVTDRSIVFSLVSLLLAGFICGYTFGGSYPMEWTALDPAEHTDVVDIKSRLISLGFPEYVLNDISAEDIAACEGAMQVVVDVTDEPVNDGRIVETEYGSGSNRYIVQDTVYDVKELRITGVGVQIPGERERWIIFHHFLWTADPGFHGTESIQLWPAYRDLSEGWISAGDVTGRVLYNANGETFAADYFFLGSRTYTSNSSFWGEQSNTDVFAAFSMPRNSEKQRGYVAYPVDEVQDGYIISSWFNYTHQKSWFQYPVMTAMEKRIANGWNDAGVFKTIQDALQFYPSDEGIEIIN